MHPRLRFSTVVLLIIPPVLWAGNAIIGRLIHTWVPPMTLNFLRWLIALVLLLPLAGSVLLSRQRMWQNWRSLAVLGLLGIGMFNSLQYLALQTSTPTNVTLVASSMPIWLIVIGRLFFAAKVRRWQVIGAAVSMCGVLVVLSRGEYRQLLALQVVPGDLYVIVAIIAWSFYSWLLTEQKELAALRADWAAFLLAQIAFGTIWSGLFSTAEWVLTSPQIRWSWLLVLALIYVAIGPAIIAFRCWGAGVARAGPMVAGVFNNLTPLLAALMSLVFLGEVPHLYHAIAFALIVGGIVLSSRASHTV